MPKVTIAQGSMPYHGKQSTGIYLELCIRSSSDHGILPVAYRRSTEGDDVHCKMPIKWMAVADIKYVVSPEA